MIVGGFGKSHALPLAGNAAGAIRGSRCGVLFSPASGHTSSIPKGGTIGAHPFQWAGRRHKMELLA
jgi:hypothetical protein